MRITANQVTYLRLLLLPLPVWMIYFGYAPEVSYLDRPIVLGALAIFVLLGLTDALDGWLARKYGSTPLGALLDPVADKIFLVAGFVPMADLRLVPPALVMIMLVRELAVTTLRSVALEEGFSFRTSAAAKLKTTVQMAGAGFILLLFLFQDGPSIAVVLGIAAAGSLVPAAVALARGRRPGWMAISAAVLICSVAVSRVFLDWRHSIETVMVVIVGFTLYSGFEYAWGMRMVLAARFRRVPIEALRLAALALVLPLLFVPALDRTGAPTFTTLGLMAAEVAAGGLDNSLVQAGRRRSAWPDLARAAVQAACGLFVVAVLETGFHPLIARAAAGVALAVTLGEFLVRLWRNRDIFQA